MATPTADVRMSLAANSAAAQIEMATSRMKRMMAETAQGADNVNRKSKKANQTIGGWYGGIAKATAGAGVMIGVLKTAQLAMSLVNDQFQRGIDVSNMARQRQVPYQEKLKKLLFEGVPGTENMEQFIKSIDQKIKGSKVRDKTALTDLIIKSISTMGDADPEDRVNFAVELAEARRDAVGGVNQESLMQLVGVAAAAQLNFADQGSSARAQLGLLSQAKNASFVSDSLNFANNVAPAGNQLAQVFGWSQAEGLALGAALSTALGDQTGGNVLTLANNISSVMKEGQMRFGVDVAGMTAMQQQEFLRSDAPKAKAFRKYVMGRFENGVGVLSDEEQAMLTEAQKNREFATNLRGKARTKYVGMQFFQPMGTADGDGSVNKLFMGALRDMGVVMKEKNVVDVVATYKAAEARQQAKESFANTDPMFGAVNDQMTTAETKESIAMGVKNFVAGELTTAGSEFDELMKQSGQGKVSRWWSRITSKYSGAGNESLEDSLERQKRIIAGVQTSLINDANSDGIFYTKRVPRRDSSGKILSIAESVLGSENPLASFRGLGPTDDQVNVFKSLGDKLDAIDQQLRTLNANDQRPKDVNVKNQPGDGQPKGPDAAAMGRQ